MKHSVLDGKKILAVDDEPDVLAVIEDLISYSCKNCTIATAERYEDAVKLIEANPYDIVILDIMGVNGFDLLKIAVKHHLKVVILTAHAISPEALKQSYEMKARAYLPKDKLADLVEFLEDVLKYDYETGWKRLIEKLHSFFTNRFESDWETKTGMNWKEWTKY